MNANCSNLSDMRNLQEGVKKAFCYQKLFWPFTVRKNCSSDLKTNILQIFLFFPNSTFSNMCIHNIFICWVSVSKGLWRPITFKLSFKRRIMLHLILKSSFLCLLFLEVDGNKYGEFDITDLETSQVFIYYRWITLGTIHILCNHL